MNTSSKNKAFIFSVVITLLVIGILFALREQQEIVTNAPKPEIIKDIKNLPNLPLFTEGLASVNIHATDIGFHTFSQDGKYFFFTGFSEVSNPPSIGYIMDTHTGKISVLPGLPERGIDDSRIMQLYTPSGTVLYYLETGEQKKFDVGDNVFYGSLSPDGTTFVVNTVEGIKKVAVGTQTVSTLSNKQYDGAYAWFSDSKRILGFQETGESFSIEEMGKARRVGIWNTDGIFSPLPLSLAKKDPRYIEWVIPDVIARVNTGWDDGSYDYLVDVVNSLVVDVGPTSLPMMAGGIATDASHSLFAVVGAMRADKPVAFIYKGMDKVASTMLTEGYSRESLAIVDDHRLLYIRKKSGEQALTLLDLTSGTETVIKTLPVGYGDLSLAPDHATWVVSSGTTFFSGTL